MRPGLHDMPLIALKYSPDIADSALLATRTALPLAAAAAAKQPEPKGKQFGCA